MGTFDLITATASLTGVAAFGGLVATAPDTLTVRNLGGETPGRLVGFGRKGATAGSVRLRSPYLHDPTNGIRGRVLAADPTSVLDYDGYQLLRPQDTLILESTGGAAAEQESGWMLNYYPRLVGRDGRYITSKELAARRVELVTNEVAVTTGAAGVWGSAALSAGTGEIKADADYAVIGWVTDVACTAVGISAPETGNFRTGGPGVTTKNFTRSFFEDMGDNMGVPAVPVFNGSNLASVVVWAVDNTAALVVNVDLVLAHVLHHADENWS